jgi:CxxC-x17-CxxC domain-containing protein
VVVESDLAFLPVLLSRSTRKQFHSGFRDTANIKGTESMTQDLLLTCSDCGQEFTFSNEDQAFFRERGYSTPKRCKACRQAKKNEQAGGGGFSRRSESQSTAVTCSGCGKQTTVPFEPRGDRPVYCQDCYSARKGSGGGREDRRRSRY